jgi:aminopeptidase C
MALFILPAYTQNNNTPPPVKSEEGQKFTKVVELKATPVKNQARSNTCWSFATTSFIESELLRTLKGEYDLSEMFVVRYTYINKLHDNYLKQGKGNLEQGGLSHDWMNVFAEYGIVPDEAYTGLNYGSPIHNHDELERFINAIGAVPVELKNESPQYFKLVNALLDTYLGKVPDSFIYKGKSYTPKTFAASLGINPDNYIEITSFTHFPFYSRGILDIPDNWTKAKFFNVPLNELIEIIDYALNNGYTVNWDGDISENGFRFLQGIAEIPEITVSQELRQAGFEGFKTTDDHLMHLTGISKDQNGNKYYITKNSWGTDRNPLGGYLNMSENYVRAKTIFIMVNKNSIPEDIKSKLGL